MKIYLSTALALLLSHYSQAQQPSVTIDNDAATIMYVGLNTPLKITASVPLEQLVVETTNGKCTLKDGKYAWTPTEAGDGSIVKIGYKEGAATKWITEKSFFTKRLPDPVIELQHENIKLAKGITAQVKDIDYACNCSITTLYVKVQAPNQEAAVYQHKGNDFSSEVKKAIARLGEDYRVEFFDAKILCPGDGASRSVAGSLIFSSGSMKQ